MTRPKYFIKKRSYHPNFAERNGGERPPEYGDDFDFDKNFDLNKLEEEVVDYFDPEDYEDDKEE